MDQSDILSSLGKIPDNDIGLAALVEQMQTPVGIIPFVGAGMSVPFGFPSWTAFLLEAAQAADKVGVIKRYIARGAYEEAAETLVKALTPSGFQDRVEARFGDRVLVGKQLAGAVTVLPLLNIGPVITTNFDRVLERVYQAAGCPFESVLYHSKVNLSVQALGRNDAVLVKLHGDWADPENRVLTASEYAKSYGAPAARRRLDHPLSKLFELLATRPVLFLGCSLNQDRTVKVLGAVAASLPTSRHYAIVERPKSHSKFQARMRLLAKHNIRPVWYPEGEHDKLRPLLEYLAEQVPLAYRRNTSQSVQAASPVAQVPRPFSSFVGREVELDTLSTWVAEPGLVTIVGTPGVGKTRVAIELLTKVRTQFRGAWFAELSQLHEPNLVAQRVALAVGTREQERRPPTEALAEYLRNGRYLVILDNCEHVRQACTQLAEYLLANCPQLTICATSREVLHITSERVFQLAPLEIPATDRLLSAAALGKIASVRLFQERSGLSLTTDNAQKVMQLCRELEGIPLAIELAAARTSSLSVGQILDSMQERLKLLTRGNGSVEERRWATLRQAIQFSYDMLTAPQKQLLIRLSVFRRGCTWEAASAVCRSDGQDRYAIADLLDDLRARSLLVVEGGDSEKRYRLLDSIREFATQELPATESQTIAVRHVAWFVSLAERGGAELLGKDQALWLDRLAGDADNFRGAIQESVRTRQGETAMRLVAALWRLTEIRGFLREGREWLKMVLDMPETRAQPALRSKVLSGAGMLAYRQGDMPTAEQYFTQSYKLEQALNDKHGMATALNDLGNVAQMAIEFAKAQSYYEQGRTLEEETHNARGVAVALFNLGTCARRLGDLDKAEDLLKQSRKKFEEAGNRRDAAFPINGLALVAMARGKLEDSITLARESLKIRNELSDKKGVADAQRTLGAIALQQGKLASALELLTESLDMARGLDDRRGMAETLELFAAASAGEKEFTTSEPLYAAAKRIREEVHVYLAPIESERRETDHAKARIALGPTEVDRLQAEGMGRRITEDIRVAHGFREKNVGETGG